MPGRRRIGQADRQRIAGIAARLMAEEGIESYAVAKRKAAERLGLKTSKNLPDNAEIDALLLEYQRLFMNTTQAQYLHQKREMALSAMRALAAFDPRLVGPVLNGTANEHSAVSLHLFAESSEDVALALTDKAIPYELTEKRVRYSARETIVYPGFRFFAGRHPVELVVFRRNDLRQAPLSPVDGKPMRRADHAHVENLLQGTAPAPGVSRSNH